MSSQPERSDAARAPGESTPRNAPWKATQCTARFQRSRRTARGTCRPQGASERRRGVQCLRKYGGGSGCGGRSCHRTCCCPLPRGPACSTWSASQGGAASSRRRRASRGCRSRCPLSLQSAGQACTLPGRFCERAALLAAVGGASRHCGSAARRRRRRFVAVEPALLVAVARLGEIRARVAALLGDVGDGAAARLRALVARLGSSRSSRSTRP